MLSTSESLVILLAITIFLLGVVVGGLAMAVMRCGP